MFVPTLVANNDNMFQGKRYPLKPNPRTRNSKIIPLNHVSSRGLRYDLRKKTLNIWAMAVRIMTLAPQEWMERISQPNRTRVMMYCTLSNAPFGVGR